MQHTVRKAATGQTGARQLANLAYAAALSFRGELLGLLFEALARAAERRVSQFNAHGMDICNGEPSG